jgi:DNA invertase Pin-like site-specific DNA recombinase
MVQIIIDSLKVIGDIVALVAAILAIVAFAIRHYIKERISAALKAKVERANEQYKHGLAQEIEAYKASLLTTLEEHKLAIDIRRSIALEFAKQRMIAFQAICRDFSSIWLTSIVGSKRLQRSEKRKTLSR